MRARHCRRLNSANEGKDERMRTVGRAIRRFVKHKASTEWVRRSWIDRKASRCTDREERRRHRPIISCQPRWPGNRYIPGPALVRPFTYIYCGHARARPPVVRTSTLYLRNFIKSGTRPSPEIRINTHIHANTHDRIPRIPRPSYEPFLVVVKTFRRPHNIR